jgi:hypothetical protein
VLRIGAEDADTPKLHDVSERLKMRAGLVTAAKERQRVSVGAHELSGADDAGGGRAVIDALLISPPPDDRRERGGVRIIQYVNVIASPLNDLSGKRRAVFDDHGKLAMNHHSQEMKRHCGSGMNADPGPSRAMEPAARMVDLLAVFSDIAHDPLRRVDHFFPTYQASPFYFLELDQKRHILTPLTRIPQLEVT